MYRSACRYEYSRSCRGIVAVVGSPASGQGQTTGGRDADIAKENDGDFEEVGRLCYTGKSIKALGKLVRPRPTNQLCDPNGLSYLEICSNSVAYRIVRAKNARLQTNTGKLHMPQNMTFDMLKKAVTDGGIDTVLV